MRESTVVHLLAGVGLVSFAVIAYATAVSTPLVTEAFGGFLVEATCFDTDELLDTSSKSCRDALEMKDIMETDVCGRYAAEQHGACHTVQEAANKKIAYCSDITNVLQDRELYIDIGEVDAQCAVLLGEA
ncbi:MAG: hypothetical protein HYY37_04560 [Candidatus Aenigmarchaeota archaeon]|nr:hypothetical protein [Candidatus Aenigmarchaeota archaeon]